MIFSEMKEHKLGFHIPFRGAAIQFLLPSLMNSSFFCASRYSQLISTFFSCDSRLYIYIVYIPKSD